MNKICVLMDKGELIQALKLTLCQTQEDINLASQAILKVLSYNCSGLPNPLFRPVQWKDTSQIFF